MRIKIKKWEDKTKLGGVIWSCDGKAKIFKKCFTKQRTETVEQMDNPKK